MNGFDISTAQGIYIGSQAISVLYLGSTQIWPAQPAPTHDYSQDYLTIVSRASNNTIKFSNNNNVGIPITIYVSTDNGNTWQTIVANSLDGYIEIARLQYNQKVLIKGNNSSYALRNTIGCNFSSLGAFNVEGNIMSLVYGDNFVNQTILTDDYTFVHLFSGNTFLQSAENLILPATTLSQYCYNNMFTNCTALTTAPELPATTLSTQCYASMFSGCTSLNYIKCLATNISAYNCTGGWVYNVAATGTFVKDPNMSSWTTGTAGIPSGWTLDPPMTHDYSQDYLTIVSTSNNNTIGWTASNANLLKTISVSTNGGTTWTAKESSTTGTTLATLNTGDKLLIKGSNTAYSTSYINYFTSSNNFNVEGNIMSLIYGDNFIGQTTLDSAGYNFGFLFNQCAKLISVENLILPATTLANYCYKNMFYGCTSLISAPELPATTLANYCYTYMFRGCTSLTTAPELPATTLAQNCYTYMFYGCTSLTTAPELPATTLAQSCYTYMFYGCTSLTTAPELPATTLAQSCYIQMFYGCTSLTTAPELPATTLAVGCYSTMFRNCTSLTTAPELPATTLTQGCYNAMFRDCTSLNYIKCLATNISATGCTTNWVNNVAATGTFVKNASMSDWGTGNNGIPSGWTLINN